jgi:hypothetical protein
VWTHNDSSALGTRSVPTALNVQKLCSSSLAAGAALRCDAGEHPVGFVAINQCGVLRVRVRLRRSPAVSD